MKKIFTLIAVAVMAMSANAQEKVIVSIPEGFTKANEVEVTNGFKIKCANDAKNIESAKVITVDGVEYTSIKVSNGAQNIVTLPEGKKAASVVFYSYVNKSTADAADRESFWKEVNGTAYDKETSGGLMSKFTDTDGFQTNPDKSATFNLGGATTFTFTNTGYQPCLVMEIVYGDGSASAINTVQNSVIDLNVPAFNIAGQKVANNYKGLVIKNGKKMIQK